MAQNNPIVNLIAQGARARGLDPNAVLAVAGQEGLSGRIGDSGHAFGPFQENNAGGVLTNRFPGWGPQRFEAWANSQAGLNDALNRIAAVARGQHGRQAISSIVSRFERPLDIPGEIARASSRYGGSLFAAGTVAPGASPQAGPQAGAGIGQQRGLSPALLSLLNQGNQMMGLDSLPAMTPPQTPKIRAQTSQALAPGTSPQTFKRGRTIRWIEHLASPFGLTITSTTGGKHVKGSYHYRGRAVDFGGAPNRMAQLARFALQHAGQISEMFYTGPGNPGYFIKNGKVIPNSQLDPGLATEHQNHVHLAK